MRITLAELKEKVTYDPDSGWFTWNKLSRDKFSNDHQFNAYNARLAGNRAGYVSKKKTGYQNRAMRINNKLITEHRLAWLYMTGDEPPRQIDHINRNALDNRWCNLRDGTDINIKNHSKHKNNTSGHSGVSWSSACGKWRAYAMVKRKQKHLGLFEKKEDAAKVVRKFHKDNGFDESHCKELAHYVD